MQNEKLKKIMHCLFLRLRGWNIIMTDLSIVGVYSETRSGKVMIAKYFSNPNVYEKDRSHSNESKNESRNEDDDLEYMYSRPRVSVRNICTSKRRGKHLEDYCDTTFRLDGVLLIYVVTPSYLNNQEFLENLKFILSFGKDVILVVDIEGHISSDKSEDESYVRKKMNAYNTKLRLMKKIYGLCGIFVISTDTGRNMRNLLDFVLEFAEKYVRDVMNMSRHQIENEISTSVSQGENEISTSVSQIENETDATNN
jgi:hypothetical protein